jgi:hypothetical protein
MALREFKDGIKREKERRAWNEDCGILGLCGVEEGAMQMVGRII